ncbi:conjugal transfer protein TrbI, partial [Enterobacter sp. CM29]|nr:conjugal transfer protein TrbI [Enterobacter sp. CM29]
MEERQKRVEEKPATYRKKGQTYLIASVGLIALLLLANMIYNIATRKSKDDEKPVEQPAANAQGADNDPDRFQQLLNNRRAKQQEEAAATPPKSPFDRQLKSSQQSGSGAGAANGAGNALGGERAETVEDRQKKLI